MINRKDNAVRDAGAPPRTTVYVAVLNDPGAYRAVQAARLAWERYEILSRNDDPEGEPWEFSSGSIVSCEWRELAEGTRLVAVERHAPTIPSLVRA